MAGYTFPGILDFVERAQVPPEVSGIFLGRASVFRLVGDHASLAAHSLASGDRESAKAQLAEAQRWLDGLRVGAQIAESAIAEVAEAIGPDPILAVEPAVVDVSESAEEAETPAETKPKRAKTK